MSSERESHVSSQHSSDKNERRKLRIQLLNDNLRRTMAGGRVMITQGLEALGSIPVSTVIQAVRQFDEFSAANDPYDEHDFGALIHAGQRILWKIDYFDKQLEFASPDPSDPRVTARVLTIMLASESSSGRHQLPPLGHPGSNLAIAV